MEVKQFDTVIMYFRRDMRVDDNPALVSALQSARRVIPLFVWAPAEEGQFIPGRTSRWWTKQSCRDLQSQVARLQSRLILRESTERCKALLQLVDEVGAQAVFFNNLYDPISLVGLRRLDVFNGRKVSNLNFPCVGQRPRNQAGPGRPESSVLQLQRRPALRTMGGPRHRRASMHNIQGLLGPVRPFRPCVSFCL